MGSSLFGSLRCVAFLLRVIELRYLFFSGKDHSIDLRLVTTECAISRTTRHAGAIYGVAREPCLIIVKGRVAVFRDALS